MRNLSRRNFLEMGIALAVCSGCTNTIARQKLLPLNSKLVLLGDSITHMGLYDDKEEGQSSSPGLSFTNQGYGNLANILCGSRFLVPLNGNQGKNADTVAQVLARLNTVIALKPAVVVLLIGINSIFQNVPEESIKYDYQSICDQLVAAGTIVIAPTILPCFPGQYGQLTPPQEALRQQINSFILSLDSIRSIDVELYMNDPKYFLDGLHPNAIGVYRLASKVAPVLNSLIVQGKVLDMKNRSGNYITNPLLEGAEGEVFQAAGVVASGWTLVANNSGAATVVACKSPNDNKQLIQLTGRYSGNGRNFQLRSKKIAALNKEEVIEGILDIEILTACTNISTIDLLIEGFNAEGELIMAGQAFYRSGYLPLQLPVGRYIMRTPPQKLKQTVTLVKAGITAMFMDAPVDSAISATFKIHNCTITRI